MNEARPVKSSRERIAALLAPRASALPAALRHSARVQRLRRLTFWGSLAIAAGLAASLALDALRFLPVDLRFAHVGLTGTRITIETPRLVGYRADGRAYEIRARVGFQDMMRPDVFELKGLELHIENNPTSAVSLTGESGVYDAKREHADIVGDVRIFDAKSFDLRMQDANVNFKTSVMSSQKPVKLTIEGGEIVSQSVEFSQKEHRATFLGGVRSIFHGDND